MKYSLQVCMDGVKIEASEKPGIFQAQTFQTWKHNWVYIKMYKRGNKPCREFSDRVMSRHKMPRLWCEAWRSNRVGSYKRSVLKLYLGVASENKVTFPAACTNFLNDLTVFTQPSDKNEERSCNGHTLFWDGGESQ